MGSSRTKSTESSWSFEDLVDFECAVRLEADDTAERIEKRDRALLARLSSEKRDFTRNRDLLYAWLQPVRNALFPESWRPGESAKGAIGITSKILFVLALVSGVTLSAGFLSYEGSEPVNVSAFVGVFILLQLALAALSVVLILALQWTAKAFDGFVGVRALRPVLFHFASSLARYAVSRVEGKHRVIAENASGDLNRMWTLYRSPLQRMAFTHFQSWAAAFNLGVVGATVLIVLFSDRAFGWQTTLQIDAEWLFQVVKITATPWSWFAGEGVGYPTLSEIEGSRIVLKDGIRSLNSKDLVSWWPYLLMGTIVYGLLPRLVFYAWGRLSLRSSLNALSFRHAEAHRIAERIRSWELGFVSDGDRSANEASVSDTAVEGPSQATPSAVERAVCLLVSDYHQALPVDELTAALSRTLSLPADRLEIRSVSAEDQVAPQKMSIDLDSSDDGNLFVVFASWLPPIEETKQLLRGIRKQVDPSRLLFIELLGPGGSENGLRDPKPEEVEMWKVFVRRLGDPYCALNESK